MNGPSPPPHPTPTRPGLHQRPGVKTPRSAEAGGSAQRRHRAPSASHLLQPARVGGQGGAALTASPPGPPPPAPSWSGEVEKQAHPEAETSPKLSLSLSATADMFCSVDSSSSNHKRPEELYDLWSFYQRLREKHVTLLRQVWAPLADRASLCSPLSVCTLNRVDITASSHTNSTTSDLELQHVFDFGQKSLMSSFFLIFPISYCLYLIFNKCL